MAKKYLTGIDLSKNELQNAAIQSLSSNPLSPVTGQVYFNTTDKVLYIFNGTAWNKLIPSGSIVNADIATNAAIALSKLATDPLARANHTGTQTASTISDLDTVVQAYTLDQFAAPAANVSFNSHKITGLADPTAAQDAATKAYVDAVKTGLDVKDSVRVATTANITLSGTQTIDGVSVVAGNRVLVKDQTTPSQNGIYVVAAGAWSRASDADVSSEVTAGLFTFVSEGDTNADSGWVLATNDSIVLGTTALSFVQFSGAGQITAGAGLTKTGTTIDVVGTSNRITVNADSIDIASTYVGQSSITTVGTISSGTWNGTTIAIANGGTGATTAAGARSALSATGKYTATNGAISPVSNIATWSIPASTHGLGATGAIIVQMKDLDTNALVDADIVINDSTGDITITWNSTTGVSAGSYRVTAVG